ncbi:zinc finger MYM-type protein 1-like [Daktulosphaira vitifoliae]|uniref:zinc finger MYM-type protein 1-like n=1 Tax=Daktulosphaira vitifoliae TaxID=58002 RepID=UPI0021AA5EE9|nr:zinc finger MYM-type protein 1-like [Daktulosphaira vitifoliae]
MSKRVNKSITDFFAKKVPRQELNTNNAKFCPEDDLSQQIENVHCQHDNLQVSLFDIELCVGKKLSNKEKIDFFQNTWTPEKTFIFPTTEFKNKKKLKFQFSWLEKWIWLAYSHKEDGAYCKYCVIFNKTEGGSQVLGNFSLKPFKIWYKAIEKFNIHEKCNYHLKAVEEYQNIVAIEAGKQDSIDLQLNKASKMQKELNRKIIIPVIESVVFCGRQGIALRGHRDFGMLTTENPIENDGNFRALMRFHMNATKLSGDESYELARTNCAKNAQYTSWKIQNEIISSCHDIILFKIIDEINNSKCFSVIADETADVAGIEQFSLCVRYFDSKSKIIKEQFLKFVPVMDLSGSALASIIIKELTDMKIEMQYIRGQGYDGAASMSGRFNGVQSCIKKEYKTAIYVHCSAHSLNLAITYACGVQSIRNTMGTIEKVFVFLNTPKRQAAFSKHVKELNQENTHKEKLKQRHDSVEVFDQLLPAVHSCLEEMTK